MNINEHTVSRNLKPAWNPHAMRLHERPKPGLRVNAKWVVIRLEVSALNRIQHEERETMTTSRENSTYNACAAN